MFEPLWYVDTDKVSMPDDFDAIVSKVKRLLTNGNHIIEVSHSPAGDIAAVGRGENTWRVETYLPSTRGNIQQWAWEFDGDDDGLILACKYMAGFAVSMGLSRCFPLGRLLTTPGANGLDWMPVLAKKHAWGDWGKVCRSDREANDMNWRAGYGRLFSAYRLDSGEDVWIITEADRSATTVLLPWEY